MKYDFKKLEELGWVVLITAVLFILQAATGLPEDYGEWRAYVVPLGGGLVRAVAGALLATLTKPE